MFWWNEGGLFVFSLFMQYYTYILQSHQDSRLYFGQTQNLEKRLQEHNSGQSKYTKPYLPWDIVAYKAFTDRKQALKFEKMLKNLHSRERVRNFISSYNFTLLKKI